ISQYSGRDRARPSSGDLCEDPKLRDLAEDSLAERSLFRRRRSQPPQVLETVNPSVVSIVPARLQCVTADDDETVELKAGVGMTDLRSQNISEHVRFATASRARTRATEELKVEIRFAAVAPLNRQLVTDLLNIFRRQSHGVSSLAGCRRNTGFLACAPSGFVTRCPKPQRTECPLGAQTTSPCSDAFVHRKWRCRPGQASRLLPLQRCNHLSFP